MDTSAVQAPVAGLTSTNSPLAEAHRDFVLGQVWSRPGLSRRDRRWVALTCAAAADAPAPIEDQVFGALDSGDMTVDELLEFVLHFAVYNGWPKASFVEGVIRIQWAMIQGARGLEATLPKIPVSGDLGPESREERIAQGITVYEDVNLLVAPEPETPYVHAGILNYVFGHVWHRPGLSRRDRRLITVPSVGVCDAVLPIQSHVGSALESGDITKPEMDEIVLQFAVYSGFAKGEALQIAVDEAWARLNP